MNKLSIFMAAAVLLAGFSLRAELVHVYEETVVGGVTNCISDSTLETGGDYETSLAPEISGYIFTHWSTTSKQVFESRDEEGRAWDSAPFHLYEQMTITANYVEASKDDDGDGLADGYELYWYGNLDKSPNSDTDGDGYSFAAEINAGTNPHFSDASFNGGIVYRDSEECLYNPYGFMPYIVRSEPEGALFATVTNYVAPGAVVTSISCDWVSTKFSYWKMDGVQQRDEDGRAVDSVTFTMPDRVVELVAVCEENASLRQKFYWYGRDVADTSDTDGDGYTYAEEIAAGTNPLFPDMSFNGGIVWKDSDLTQYNPLRIQMYIIRSEPEGELFDSITNYVKYGTSVTTPVCDYSETDFAYWTMNGVQQRDEDGRAVDSVTFTMPNYEVELVAVTIPDKTEREAVYWYGAATDSSSDTDGDGYTFAQELAAGTNPIFPDTSFNGGVVWKDSDLAELNLQVYEQVQGVVVDGAFEPLFTSPVAGNGATSETFGNGSQIWPVVVDVNSDGKWDLVVCWEKESGGVESGEVESLEFRVFLNVGSAGNPEFVEGENVSIPKSVDLAMNSTDKLAGLTLDVEPINALSATTNGTTLLVSDTEGRIWFYEGLVVSSQESGVSNSSTPSIPHSLTYALQHKVWGGSHAGFANGLMLAAVDWEDDGDLDCICGTAEGKLMLLRDPKVGRPTNLKLLAGIDNVLLTWEPNQQSRIRGYKVYRGTGNGEEGTDGYTALVPGVPNVSSMYTTALPRYRDFPNSSTPNFSYKVSSISRFYTAGNSTPTITESPATEAVSAQLGTVKFFWNDVICKLGANANVMLSIENSMNFNVAGKTQVVSYDSTYLKPIKVVPSGLTEGVSFTESVADGKWTINLINGNLPAGSGKFFTLVFETLKEGETKVGDAKVTIEKVESIDPTVVPPWSLGDMNGDGRLTKEDAQILARLKQSSKPKWNERELKAGDFNGNGKLDNADYQSLREKLKSLGVFGGGK